MRIGYGGKNLGDEMVVCGGLTFFNLLSRDMRQDFTDRLTAAIITVTNCASTDFSLDIPTVAAVQLLGI